MCMYSATPNQEQWDIVQLRRVGHRQRRKEHRQLNYLKESKQQDSGDRVRLKLWD